MAHIIKITSDHSYHRSGLKTQYLALERPSEAVENAVGRYNQRVNDSYYRIGLYVDGERVVGSGYRRSCTRDAIFARPVGWISLLAWSGAVAAASLLFSLWLLATIVLGIAAIAIQGTRSLRKSDTLLLKQLGKQPYVIEISNKDSVLHYALASERWVRYKPCDFAVLARYHSEKMNALPKKQIIDEEFLAREYPEVLKDVQKSYRESRESWAQDTNPEKWVKKLGDHAYAVATQITNDPDIIGAFEVERAVAANRELPVYTQRAADDELLDTHRALVAERVKEIIEDAQAQLSADAELAHDQVRAQASQLFTQKRL